jgi:LPS O-antigen subunit length determinant protein (WzzB/FepE family)
MPTSGTARRVKASREKEEGVVGRSLYSGLVVIGGVALAFVAFALTVAFRA